MIYLKRAHVPRRSNTLNDWDAGLYCMIILAAPEFTTNK